MVTARDFERESDVRLIQDLCAETWRLLGPLATTHIGDVAWWRYQRTDRLAVSRIRLWLEDGRCVALGWNWLSKDAIDCVVHPECASLLDEVIEWADAGTFYTQEHDTPKIERLTAHGYDRVDGAVGNHMVRPLDREAPLPALPDGYAIRSVGPSDLERRVEVHRAAFAPSRLTVESYSRVQRAWPYRADLDHVVEAPDGSFAAFCLAWLDDRNRAGLLEPVGTHPDHRRLGLATAVVTAAVNSLRAEGAEVVVIGSEDDSPAERVYEGVGFRTVTRDVPYGKKPADGVV